MNPLLRGAPVRTFCLLLLVLGIFLRFTGLGHKSYWHDEAYTSLRAAGYTIEDVDQKLFGDRPVSVAELQVFQRLKPQSTIDDTIRSLAVEDPQHPPFYFLLSRAWMQLWGPERAAMRSLAAVVGLLGIPLIYALARDLTGNDRMGWVAAAVYALSPFEILFAQLARQYSLLSVLTIASGWCLWRSHQGGQRWLSYTLINALGLYTHPFMVLSVLSNGAFLVLLREGRSLRRWLLSVAASLFLFSPWLWVIVRNYQRIRDTTSWAAGPFELGYALRLWILGFTAPFVDLDFGFDNGLTYLLRLPFLGLILWGGISLWRREGAPTRLFILTWCLIPFALLLLPDLILGGRRSTVSRYLISCIPAVELLMVWAVTSLRRWEVLWAPVAAASLASATISTASDAWWTLDLSYHNASVVRQITAHSTESAGVVIGDRGDDFTNLGDLLSLGHELPETTRLFLLAAEPDGEKLAAQLRRDSRPLFFRPSARLRQQVAAFGSTLMPPNPPTRLWHVYDAGTIAAPPLDK